MTENTVLPLRPTAHVEQEIVTAILQGRYAAGTTLPNERTLSEQLGVTRPTLRETLKRLSAEGWIRIRHGKPTLVNDIWQAGGLGLLATLAKYTDNLPKSFIRHLLEVRVALLPAVAKLAAHRSPETISALLEDAPASRDSAERFVEFDWDLQITMVRGSGNPIFPLILNDFETVFKMLAAVYFRKENGRAASLNYYERLGLALSRDPEKVDAAVLVAMRESIRIWERIESLEGETHEKVEWLGG
jgi:GntR family negative regulator for fad regulon and positive regulator of fabA